MKKILIALVTLVALSTMLLAAPKDAKMNDKPGNDNDQPCRMYGTGGGGGNGHEMGMGMMKGIMDELNLTKDQIKKLDALKTEHKKTMNTKEAELDNLMIDKHNAMMAEKFDIAQIKGINKSIADAQLAIDNMKVDHHAAVVKELTPEQQTKLREMMPKGMGMGKGGCKGMDKGMGMHKGMNKGNGMHKGMGNGCAGDCK
jgi:Spy/CpxP family protein refolding chaperone